MRDRRVITATGASIDEAVIQEFKASLRGQLLRPGDEGYDEARKVWNGMFDRRLCQGRLVRTWDRRNGLSGRIIGIRLTDRAFMVPIVLVPLHDCNELLSEIRADALNVQQEIGNGG